MRNKSDKKARENALKQSWDGTHFKCFYSGINLVEDNPKDPRYITFDHKTPRKEDDIVMVAAVINDMKSDMSDSEFRAMVNQLSNRFHDMRFDSNVFNLKYWKR